MLLRKYSSKYRVLEILFLRKPLRSKRNKNIISCSEVVKRGR